MKNWLLIAVLVFSVPGLAFAACNNPAGDEGAIVYNGTHKVVQFCNGANWISAGSSTDLSSLNADHLTSGTVPAARLPAYSGDVTKAAGGTALTIADNAVTTAKIAASAVTNAEIANATIVATTKLSATGTKNATTFLRGDDTWATPAAGGGGVSAVTNVSCSVPNGTSGCTAQCPAGYFSASAVVVVVSSKDRFPCIESTDIYPGANSCWYPSADTARIQNSAWYSNARTLHVRCLK